MQTWAARIYLGAAANVQGRIGWFVSTYAAYLHEYTVHTNI